MWHWSNVGELLFHCLRCWPAPLRHWVNVPCLFLWKQLVFCDTPDKIIWPVYQIAVDTSIQSGISQQTADWFTSRSGDFLLGNNVKAKLGKVDGRFWEPEMKWNESGFRPPLCTYRLNWARRTSWGWWDDWDDTVLQTQDSKFEPWRSEAEQATSRSRRLPTILTFTRGWGRNIFVSFKQPRPGTEPQTLAWKAAVSKRLYV